MSDDWCPENDAAYRAELAARMTDDVYVKLRRRAEKAEAERDALRDREKHFASVLSVADGGQYRNDWDAAIRRVVAERDALREALSLIAVMGYSNDPAINDGIAKQAVGQARAALNRETDI